MAWECSVLAAESENHDVRVTITSDIALHHDHHDKSNDYYRNKTKSGLVSYEVEPPPLCQISAI